MELKARLLVMVRKRCRSIQVFFIVILELLLRLKLKFIEVRFQPNQSYFYVNN